MIDKISQCIGGNKMNECAFGTKDPVYLNYHDHVWGQLPMIARHCLNF